MDSLTTHKLNKMYHIDGYRITKIKGELMLKAERKIKDKEEGDEENIRDEINELRDEIAKIKDAYNKLIEFINGAKPSITEQ